MTEYEIGQRLKEIKKNAKMIDKIIYVNYKTNEGRLNERQIQMFKKMILIIGYH